MTEVMTTRSEDRGSRYGRASGRRAGARPRQAKGQPSSRRDERTARILLTAQEAIHHAHAQETLWSFRTQYPVLRGPTRVQRGAAVARVQSYLRIPRC